MININTIPPSILLFVIASMLILFILREISIRNQRPKVFDPYEFKKKRFNFTLRRKNGSKRKGVKH